MCKQEGGNTEPWEVPRLARLSISPFTIQKQWTGSEESERMGHSIVTHMFRDVVIKTHYFV